MRGVVLLPDRNSRGKFDQSGAFEPEARAFAKLHGIPEDHVVELDISAEQGARAAQFLTALRDRAKGPAFSLVGFFGHGLTNNLPQFRLVTAPKLAGVLGSVKVPDVHVAFYACSTAAGEKLTGDGGYADGVRDAMQRNGSINCTVDGHTTAGHASMNPNVRRFSGLGTNDAGVLVSGGTGGAWIVAPGTPKTWNAWKAWLKTDGRFRFPLMTIEQIRAELAA